MQKKISKQVKKKALLKSDVSLQLVCDNCYAKKTKNNKDECKCGKGNFWIEQPNIFTNN